ncbi:bifunctional deaminase-reductase domain protein [Kribbella flavida DSM 17836]|uniref:Bifunctional deaminase-reductase domain protein n=1 Tax=Kribbella flavida (strain DSM 17836 / JCM 10339 / NBRC 14399) TaxID=479435 RepID=D2PYB6_KRIFD|nr:dihydrofolate reductase family protein [Kribbella flavida]ADB35484.1 bifunctional deaminase-reductase domain protein [Kribbella flavida DSM 17836]
MGQLVITTNATLDGVVEDPDGQEGSAGGGWFARFGGKDLAEWTKVTTDEALHAEALLLGRRSDEWFGTRWPARTGELADRLNSLPKYVVSAGRRSPVWTNCTVLSGNVVDEVSRLKQQRDGDILVYASRQLGRTLLEHNLVDELRLMLFPVVLGSGRRLFDDTSATTPLRLLRHRTIGDNLTLLTYRPEVTPVR